MPLIDLPRTCTWTPGEGKLRESRPIEEFRDRRCYVLLGDPGAGKSSVFAQEAAVAGPVGDGVIIAARNFINLPLRPSWNNKVLFIDGLDEMRAGGIDGRPPLDAILKRLAELGSPPFRLSCREADWLGASDQGALLALYDDVEILPVLHLDELNEASAQALLEHYEVPSPTEFLTKARSKGLHDFLRTPLNVELLVKAVGNGKNWPDTRFATYALAVDTLVKEANGEHQVATRNQPTSTADLLTSAGELGTVLLLAQIEGYALDAVAEDAAHPAIANLDIDKSAALAALRTKLFIANGAESLRKPFHRTIAEYLSAKYLAQRVAQGEHSTTRVLALLSLADGTIVPSLRGLAAWLAVFSLPCRAELIERDPAGMLVYGDAASLSDEDLAHILRAYERLARHSPNQRFNHWDEAMIAALARPSLASVLTGYLAEPAPDEATQAVQRLILNAFDHAAPAQELLPRLEALARNETLWPTIRCAAVAAWVPQLDDPKPALTLLDELAAERAPNENSELFGSLLALLFPWHLGADRLRPYLYLPRRPYHSSAYTWFWEHIFFERAQPNDVHRVLDALAKEPLRACTDTNFHIRRFLGCLLATGLESLSTSIAVERLALWLAVGVDDFVTILEPEHRTRIQTWLYLHPDRYKTLLLYLIHGCGAKDDFHFCMGKARSIFYGSPFPADYTDWCLEMAEREPSTVVAQFFFSEAYSNAFSPSGKWQGSRLEDFECWIEKHPDFRPLWEHRIYCEIPEYLKEFAQQRNERETTQRKNRETFAEQIRSHLDALHSNTAPPGLLHDLAFVYEGHFGDIRGDSPLDRLQALLGDDKALISKITQALHQAIDRTDVPSVADIIDTDIKGKHFYLRPACLIALDRRQAQGDQQVLALSDEQLGKALAFRFTFDADQEPKWVKLLRQEKPDLYANIYQAYATANLKAGRQHIAGLHALAHDPDLKDLAATIGPQLLPCIPLRIKKDRLNHLRHLLAAGLHHFPNKLMELAEARLALKGLDAPQRVLWMTCAALLHPDQYGDTLSRHVGPQETRAAVLAEFLDANHGTSSVPGPLPPSMLDRLIRILGPIYPPLHPEGAHWVSPAERAGDCVEAFINQLARYPGKEAEHLLQALLTFKPLAAWKSRMEFALDNQRNATRETEFRAPTATQVVASLQQGRPANPEELKALVFEQLKQIARQVRHGDTNDYRRLWVEDHPDIENNCRDFLLSLIRPHLERLGIEAQKEGYFAEDKRADIRVSYNSGEWIVPIEIKRDCHSEVWRAMKNQLTDLYMPDPRAFGQGIYLVLWFGGKGAPLPPQGARPTSAADMEQRLRNLLTPAEQRQIAVLIMDVSRPS